MKKTFRKKREDINKKEENDKRLLSVVYREFPVSPFYIMKVLQIKYNLYAKLKCDDFECKSYAEYNMKEKELILITPHSKKFENHSYFNKDLKDAKNDYINYMIKNTNILAIEIKKQKNKNLIIPISNFKFSIKENKINNNLIDNNNKENEKKINFIIEGKKDDITTNNQKKNKIILDEDDDTCKTIEKPNNIIKIENSWQNESSINIEETQENIKIMTITNDIDTPIKQEVKPDNSIKLNNKIELTSNDINIINTELNHHFNKESKNGKIIETKEKETSITKHIINLGNKKENDKDYEISEYYDDFKVDNDMDGKVIDKILNKKNINNNIIIEKEPEIIELKDEELFSHNKMNEYNTFRKAYTGKKRGRKKKVILINDEENTNINEIGDDEIKIVGKNTKFKIQLGENNISLDSEKLDSEKIISLNDNSQLNSLNSSMNFNYKPHNIFKVIRPSSEINNQIRK